MKYFQGTKTYKMSLIVCLLLGFFFYSEASTKSEEAIKLECEHAADKFDYSKLSALAGKLITESGKSNNERLEAYGYFYKGGSELFSGHSEDAIKYLERALEMSARIENDTLLAQIYNALGIYEANVNNNLNVAQAYFFKSIQHARNCNYERIEKSMGSNLAELAIQLQDTSGIKYALECYNYGIQSSQARYVYSGAANLAQLYLINKEYDKAKHYAIESLSLCKRNGYKTEGQILYIFSEIEYAMENIEKAREYAIQSLNDKNLDDILRPKVMYLIAKTYFDKSQYHISYNWLIKAVEFAESHKSLGAIPIIYELISKNLEAIGDKEGALKYLKLSIDSSESQLKRVKDQLDNERQLVLNIERQENEIKLQKLTNASYKKIIIALIIITLLLLLIISIIFDNRRRRFKLAKKLLFNPQKQ